MKKLTAIILCISMLCALCACGTKTGTAEFPREISLNALQSLKTKEDFARLLGIEKPEDTQQLLAYIRNYYNHLPYEDDGAAAADFGTTEDGYNCLTIDQARALVTPVVLTPDNWKEYIEPSVRTITDTYTDENDNEVEESYTEVNIGLKEGYYPLWSDFHLILYNKATGVSSDYTGWFWPEQVSCEDGKYYVEAYSEERGEVKAEFNPDNYTCTYADGVIYKNDIDKKFCYIEEWNEETYEYEFRPAGETEVGTAYNDAIVFVLHSDDNADYSCIGYSGTGDYVYCDEEVLAARKKDKEIAMKPAKELTLDVLQACRTKEELAAILGVSNLSQMNQYLIYMRNFYNHLPFEGEKKEPVTSWGTSADGYPFLTVEDAKTLVTPCIITTENWKDFVVPFMENIESWSYDENGNEICEVKQAPQIGFSYDYYYYRSDIRLNFINNNTGNEFTFYGTWAENVSSEDGKYFVTSFDENGLGKDVEFNPDDYTCTYADGVIYQYDLSRELLCREYLDEEREEWVTEKIGDCEDEYDEYELIVFVQYGKTDADISSVGYTGLGSYVFVDVNLERLLDEAENE